MEDKKLIKSKGRKLEGKELQEHLSAFIDIDESIKNLYRDKKNGSRRKKV